MQYIHRSDSTLGFPVGNRNYEFLPSFYSRDGHLSVPSEVWKRWAINAIGGHPPFDDRAQG